MNSAVRARVVSGHGLVVVSTCNGTCKMLQFSDSVYGLHVHRILGRTPAEAIDLSLKSAPTPGATQPLSHSMDPESFFPKGKTVGA